MNADTDTVVTGEGDDEKIYTLARSEITGWTIVGCMNMAELLKSSKEANNIYVMTAIVLVVIAMLISILWKGFRKEISRQQMIWLYLPRMKLEVLPHHSM